MLTPGILSQWLMKMMDTNKHVMSHSFRHMNIYLLLEAEVPAAAEIQRRVGHSDTNMIMKANAHMTKNVKSKASVQFSSHLSEMTKKLQ